MHNRSIHEVEAALNDKIRETLQHVEYDEDDREQYLDYQNRIKNELLFNMMQKERELSPTQTKHGNRKGSNAGGSKQISDLRSYR